MNWVLTLPLFSLILCVTATGQYSVDLLKFHGPAETHEDSSEKALSVAVQLKKEHLKNVSASLLMAETWVRAHVLAYYPANNVTTILVGETILCKNGDANNNLSLILPSVKNIHHSLTRWGLQNDIKVAASFAPPCVEISKSEAYVAESYIKPILKTLQDIDSPYVVNPPQNLYSESLTQLKSHLLSMGLENMSIMVMGSSKKQKTFTGRKLSYADFGSSIDPFPPRPTPISPTHPPGFAAISPLPPLIGTISPVSSPSFLPHSAPMVEPTTPPFGPHLPPCTPSEGGGAGAPATPVHSGVWCVAKPSVPSDTLQEALDYACGEGGADCEAIRPNGSCYFPDNLVAHASYAFNSYWQKSKGNGGSCGFGGTAMLINSDPKTCPGVVSCADIVVLDARESVLASGGPYYPLYTGRRDSKTFSEQDALNLHVPDDDLPKVIEKFASKGFDERETVSLLGAHSTGTILCSFINGAQQFPSRPFIDPQFLETLRSTCNGSHLSSKPSDSTSSSRSPSSYVCSLSESPPSEDPGMKMDYEEHGKDFGTLYYRSLLQKKGLLFSDQQLTAGDQTNIWVQAYASDHSLFKRDFGLTMMKLSNIQVLTAPKGEVRLD